VLLSFQPISSPVEGKKEDKSIRGGRNEGTKARGHEGKRERGKDNIPTVANEAYFCTVLGS
jgi:hypothetical protein